VGRARALRLAIGLAALTYVVLVHDVRYVAARLRDVDGGWVLLALAVVYGALLVRSVKWQNILACFGQRERLGRLWALYVESCFFNLLFPGNVAGDVSRITRSSVEGRFSMRAMTGVLLERLSGLLTTALFVAGVGVAGGYAGLGDLGHAVVWLGLIGAAAIALVPFLLRSLGVPAAVVPPAWRPGVARRADQLREAAATLLAHPRLVWRLVVLSLVFVALSGATAVALGRAIGSPVPAHLLMLYTPLIALVANLPVSVIGLGVRENLYVVVYAALGFRAEDGLALALTESALLLVVSLSGGALLWRPRRASTTVAAAPPAAPRPYR
jgi:uncharacterized membrane protein YbhN (UPF0104 family)